MYVVGDIWVNASSNANEDIVAYSSTSIPIKIRSGSGSSNYPFITAGNTYIYNQSSSNTLGITQSQGTTSVSFSGGTVTVGGKSII